MSEKSNLIQNEKPLSLKVCITGGLIYVSGDALAAIVQNQFDAFRSLVMFLIGSTLYAFEITNYFKWIESRFGHQHGFRYKWLKASYALLYFNPLWISRHMFFIIISSRQWDKLNFQILSSASTAFFINIPVSIIANYVIQNRIEPKFRFWASAIFSGIMAIYYSMGMVWF